MRTLRGRKGQARRIGAMNKAEYLSVLVSIIIGMGLSHLLSSLARLIVARARVRIYWVSLVTAAVTFLAHVQFWWSTYDYDEAILGNFFSFLVFLLAPILLYLMAVLVFPDFDDDVANVSMYDHYFSVRPWFFAVGAAVVVANVVRNTAVQGAPLLSEDRPFEAGFLLLMLTGALVRRPRVHAVITVVMLMAFCAMIVFTSLEPG
jgi:hypothetical protein